MDELVYVAMTGAKQLMLAQSINSHNLANANTVGFRADLHGFESVPIDGPGYQTRINVQVESVGWSNANGALISTGNLLDVAVNGDGWLAIQAPDGSEAYTKAGDLRVNSVGMLTNGASHPVMGESGPVAVPPHSKLMIGADGTVSIIPLGQGPETAATVDRLKLVNPLAADLIKGDDGLLRLADGSEASTDASVTLTTGVLAASNVNVVDAMVTMIELGRQFELQVRMMDTADENASAAASLMRLS